MGSSVNHGIGGTRSATLRPRQRGVSLIEASITVAIVAVVASAGLPSFGDMRDRRTLDGVSAELSTDLQYVRSEAVARNQSIRLTVQPLAGGACYVIHTGAAGDCPCAADGSTTCSNGATALKTVHLPVERRVQLASNSASMLWHPTLGTASPAGTLRLEAANGRAIHHIVSVMGRVRTCSPQAKVAGHKAC